MKKPCAIGWKTRFQKACRDWNRQQGKCASTGTLDHNIVGTLPAPPAPGSTAYANCMDEWMEAYRLAKLIQDELKQLEALKRNYLLLQTLPLNYPERDKLIQSAWKLVGAKEVRIRQLNVALDAQKLAYSDCLNGMPV